MSSEPYAIPPKDRAFEGILWYIKHYDLQSGDRLPAERVLCEELGVRFLTVDISASVRQHFKDIGQREENTDLTYENCQARERTQVLMDMANREGGLVVGTGDLSELALGWATYNGDHMSMYAVNASVPKTLVRCIIRYEAGRCAPAARRTGASAKRPRTLWGLTSCMISSSTICSASAPARSAYCAWPAWPSGPTTTGRRSSAG